MLFSGTIAADPLAGVPGARFEQAVPGVARWPAFTRSIENLPRGYQTEIGERGVGAVRRPEAAGWRSRGRRRSVPARRSSTRPTSGLDDVSAEHIGQAVMNFPRGRGGLALFVAHRVPKCSTYDLFQRYSTWCAPLL